MRQATRYVVNVEGQTCATGAIQQSKDLSDILVRTVCARMSSVNTIDREARPPPSRCDTDMAGGK